jgi:hypothetical protein
MYLNTGELSPGKMGCFSCPEFGCIAYAGAVEYRRR